MDGEGLATLGPHPSRYAIITHHEQSIVQKKNRCLEHRYDCDGDLGSVAMAEPQFVIGGRDQPFWAVQKTSRYGSKSAGNQECLADIPAGTRLPA